MAYLKKLKPVEALPFTGNNYDVLNDFVTSGCIDKENHDYIEKRNMVLMTKRGEQIINIGDFVIEEPNGEHFVCDGDFFKENYILEHKIDAISDGFHTFRELYRYRMMYNAGFFNSLHKLGEIPVCKSLKHSDGSECFGGGWFIVMAELPTGQISNHYEFEYWDLFHIPQRETGFEYDGHTPAEALERLRKYCNGDYDNSNHSNNIVSYDKFYHTSTSEYHKTDNMG